MRRQPETEREAEKEPEAPSPRTCPAQERTDRRAQEGRGLRRERVATNRMTLTAHNYCVNGRLREEENDEDQEQEKKADDDDVDGNEHDNVPSF
jgi:hypothetical protein